MAKVKLIIDTDPGIDDAMAIFYAASEPEIDLLALTTIFGNVTTSQASRNALYLIDKLGLDIPVSQGLECPRVLPPFPPSSNVHGFEGLGTLHVRPSPVSPINQSAPEYLVEMAQEHKGEMVICPIGPLTNIAAAMDLDSNFCSNLQRMVIMGGSLRAGGNITPFAEANIYHDPHAANHVLQHGKNIMLVGLDVTNKVICPRSFFYEIAKHSRRLGSLLLEMSEFYIDFYEIVGKFDGCGMHDPSALIACVVPELFQTETHKLRVCCDGESSGEILVDPEGPGNLVDVCVEVDIEAVKQKFFQKVTQLP